MAVIEGTGALKSWQGEYDFAVDAGAIGTIALRGVNGTQGPIPSGAYVYGGVLDILTLFTTGTAATAALTVEAANDIVSATVVSGAPYSTAGVKAGSVVLVNATPTKTTAARSPSIVIATGTVTAGKLRLTLFYR
jgi:hypothetical protein